MDFTNDQVQHKPELLKRFATRNSSKCSVTSMEPLRRDLPYDRGVTS